MFYPTQLLNYPQRTELVLCWFAATMSERSFKNRNKSVTINKIKVTKICKEILQIICNNHGMRSSLYLSSQLMYGVTKLHLYQITYYEKEVFEIQKFDLMLRREREKHIDAVEDFDIDPFKLPLVREDNPQLDENLHLLPEQDLSDRLRMIREAEVCQYFGALTDKELDIMYKDDIFSLEKRLQTVRYSQERDGIEMIDDIEIAEEIHQERHSSQKILSPVLMNVSNTNAKSKELPLISQKRDAPCQPQTEIPTKRRHLSKDTMAVPLTEDVTVEGIRAPISPQQVESNIVLQSLESSSSNFVIKISKKIIDRKTTLNGKLLQKWRSDVNIHCSQSKMAQIHFTPAKNLLTRPSSHKQCGAHLRPLFNNHFTRPSTSSRQDIVPTELMQPEEALRAEETTSKLNLPTELSALEKNTIITADGSALVHEVSAMPPPEMTVPDMIAEEDITKDITKREHNQKKTDSNETDESLIDIVNLLERQHLEADHIILESDHIILESSVCSSSTSQAISLTSRDILGLLEALLSEKEHIKFNELISHKYSAEDKTTAFHILLELHAEQKIVLVQTDCRDTLWIRKFNI